MLNKEWKEYLYFCSIRIIPTNMQIERFNGILNLFSTPFKFLMNYKLKFKLFGITSG